MATAAPPLAQLSAASRQTNKPGRKFRENGRQILGKTVKPALFGTKHGWKKELPNADRIADGGGNASGVWSDAR
jgi:hypothetical protein